MQGVFYIVLLIVSITNSSISLMGNKLIRPNPTQCIVYFLSDFSRRIENN